MRFLLVSFGNSIGEVFKRQLENDAVCDFAYNLDDGLFFASGNEYDAVILTASIGVDSCLEICKELRDDGCSAVLVYLSSEYSSEEKILSLNSGVDVYLSLSSPVEELKAEMYALIRRAGFGVRNFVRFKGFCLCLHSKILSYGDELIELRRKEYDLTEYFALNVGKILSSEKLLEHVWQCGLDVPSNTLAVHIRSLRKKFRNYTLEKVIETKRGLGYVLFA